MIGARGGRYLRGNEIGKARTRYPLATTANSIAKTTSIEAMIVDFSVSRESQITTVRCARPAARISTARSAKMVRVRGSGRRDEQASAARSSSGSPVYGTVTGIVVTASAPWNDFGINTSGIFFAVPRDANAA